jgi:uncharacterized membrane protein YkoI
MKVVFALAAALAATPVSAQGTICFTPEDARLAVSTHGLVPLERAVRSARLQGQGDLLAARLCETEAGIVYFLAMLHDDGKVWRIRVDAKSGDLLRAP